MVAQCRRGSGHALSGSVPNNVPATCRPHMHIPCVCRVRCYFEDCSTQTTGAVARSTWLGMRLNHVHFQRPSTRRRRPSTRVTDTKRISVLPKASSFNAPRSPGGSRPEPLSCRPLGKTLLGPCCAPCPAPPCALAAKETRSQAPAVSSTPGCPVRRRSASPLLPRPPRCRGEPASGAGTTRF